LKGHANSRVAAFYTYKTLYKYPAAYLSTSGTENSAPMPSQLSEPPTGARRAQDLDSYDVDDFDDPFRSPSPQPDASKKRKQGEGDLGIDEEVSVAKKARVPNVKLDETASVFLAPKDTSCKWLIPEMPDYYQIGESPSYGNEPRTSSSKARAMKYVPCIPIPGGLPCPLTSIRQFSDAARLLAFYQLWLDDLFPKAKFLDALAMVEKVGHRKFLTKYRLDWINEDKPRAHADGDDEFLAADSTKAADAPAEAPNQHVVVERPKTPARDDVPDDDDIYDATPRAGARPAARPGTTTTAPGGDEDEMDDLDALIAETEAAEAGQARSSESVLPTADSFADDEEAMAEMDGLW